MPPDTFDMIEGGQFSIFTFIEAGLVSLLIHK